MPHENPSDEILRQILTDARTIAVVGASSKPDRPSNGIFGKLQSGGYRVIPVNPSETEVLGERAYPSLAAVPVRIDIVNVFRRSEATPQIAEEAAAIGAKVLWLQAGVWSEEAAALAQARSLTVVMDACIGVVHSRLRIPRKQGAS